MSLADYQKRIGIALRSLRNGTSQRDVAEKLQMRRTYYSAIERGEENISLYTLHRFATFHHVTIAHILDLAEKLK